MTAEAYFLRARFDDWAVSSKRTTVNGVKRPVSQGHHAALVAKRPWPFMAGRGPVLERNQAPVGEACHVVDSTGKVPTDEREKERRKDATN
jgi:hypothetical protein